MYFLFEYLPYLGLPKGIEFRFLFYNHRPVYIEELVLFKTAALPL